MHSFTRPPQRHSPDQRRKPSTALVSSTVIFRAWHGPTNRMFPGPVLSWCLVCPHSEVTIQREPTERVIDWVRRRRLERWRSNLAFVGILSHLVAGQMLFVKYLFNLGALEFPLALCLGVGLLWFLQAH